MSRRRALAVLVACIAIVLGLLSDGQWTDPLFANGTGTTGRLPDEAPTEPPVRFEFEPGSPVSGESSSGKVRLSVPGDLYSRTLSIEISPRPKRNFVATRVIAEWELNAYDKDKGNVRVHQFESELEVSFTYDEDDVRALNLGTLKLYYLDEEANDWVPLPSDHDWETRTITAKTDHFSVFGAQAEPAYSIPGEVLNFQTNLNSGSANYTFPIELPPIPGNLPGIQLSYSSASVDEMKNKRDVASWVGMGWSLNLGAVFFNEETGEKSLQLPNGTSAKIIAAWKTEPEIGLRIEPIGNYLLVTDRDGTKYKFGGHYSTIQHRATSHQHIFQYRYDLRDVCDVDGNCLIVTWDQYEIPNDLGNPDGTIRAAYPATLTYKTGGVSGTTQFAVEFTRDTARNDVPVTQQYGSTLSPQVTEPARLTDILVKVNSELVRKYKLSQSSTNQQWCTDYGGISYAGDMWLTEVNEYGSDGSSILQTTYFSYEQRPIYFRDSLAPNGTGSCGGNPGNPAVISQSYLTEVTSHFGGTVTFEYVEKPDDRIVNTWSRNVIASQTVNPDPSEMIGLPPVTTMFLYHGAPEYYVDDDSNPDTNDHFGAEYRGFRKVTAFNADGSYSIHHFYTTGTTQWTNPGLGTQVTRDGDRLKGREYLVEQLDNLNVLQLSRYSDWDVDIDPQNQDVYRVLLKNSGTKLGGSGQTNWSFFEHDQYGNIVEEEHVGTPNSTDDDWKVYRDFVPNTNAWIISKPSAERTYAGLSADDHGTALASERRYYYDNLALGAVPPKGRLTETRDFTGAAPDDPYPGQIHYWSMSASSQYEESGVFYVKDKVGNDDVKVYPPSGAAELADTGTSRGDAYYLPGNSHLWVHADDLDLDPNHYSISFWSRQHGENCNGSDIGIAAIGIATTEFYAVDCSDIFRFHGEFWNPQTAQWEYKSYAIGPRSVGSWVQTALSFDSSTGRLIIRRGGTTYVDELTPYTKINLENGSWARLGWYSFGGSLVTEWYGHIDEVRLFDRALTESELIFVGSLSEDDINNPWESDEYTRHQYAYDNQGRVTSEWNPTASKTSYTYDSNHGSYITQTTFPTVAAGTFSEQVDWDFRLGVPLAITDANGVQTGYEYDVFGRLTAVIRDGDTPQDPTIKYQYLDWGTPGLQRIRIESKVSATEYTWTEEYLDGLGRAVQTHSQDIDNQRLISSTVVFDAAGANAGTYAPWRVSDSGPGYIPPPGGSLQSATASGSVATSREVGGDDWTSPGSVFANDGVYAQWQGLGNAEASTGWKNPSSSSLFGSYTASWSTYVDHSELNFSDGKRAQWSYSWSGYSNFLKAEGFNFGVPTGAVITGIRAKLQRYKCTSCSLTQTRLALSSGTELVSASQPNEAWPYIETYTEYGGSNDVWESSLSPNTVNQYSFGIALRVQNFSSQATWGKVNHVQMDVFYRPTSEPELSDFLQIEGFGLNVPSDATITGIEVRIDRSAPTQPAWAAPRDKTLKLLKDGVTVGPNRAKQAEIWPTSDAQATYGGPYDDWGVRWTPADVNDPDFGVELQVSGIEPGLAKVDHVEITVHYRSPGITVPRSYTTYDSLGRVLTQTDFDGSVTTHAYTALADAGKMWRKTTWDAEGRKTDRDFDVQGRVVQVREYNGANVYRVTQYTYDTLGNLVKVEIDPVIDSLLPTLIYSMEYDWLGRKTAMSDPDLGDWQYAYDNAGNLVRQTDARGTVLEFEYDAVNRLLRRCTPDCDTGTILAQHGYDDTTGGNYGIGRLTSVDAPEASVSDSYVYDSRGRVLSEARTIDTSQYLTGYAYDAAGRIIAVTLPNSEVVTSTFTDRGLPGTLSSSLHGGLVNSAQYNALGLPTQTMFGNDVETHREYWGIEHTGTPSNQNFGQLYEIHTLLPGAGSPDRFHLQYEWDDVGNLVSRTNVLATETEMFAYDFLDRLISVSGAYSQAFSYDGHDNITEKDGNAYLYQENATLMEGAERELDPIYASDGQDGDVFSWDVAVDGDVAVIGSRPDGSGEPGFAYVFERDGSGAWTEAAKLVPSDGDAYDSFGTAVAVSGGYVFVGANGDDDKGSSAGAVYVFERDGSGGWTESQKLTASDGTPFDFFGVTVAADGEFVVIGAYSYAGDTSGISAGSAYVFRNVSGMWTQFQKLTASDGDDGDRFGYGVGIHGDVIVVGAYQDDAAGTDAGAAYVFEFDGFSWTEVEKLIGSNTVAGDRLGVTVDVHDDVIVLGAPAHAIGTEGWVGEAYVFRRDSVLGWQEEQVLRPSDSVNGDGFGTAVAVHEDVIVIGSWWNDVEWVTNSGAAYVFAYKSGQWVEMDKLRSQSLEESELFGGKVGIDGSTVLVGAHGRDNTPGTDRGAFYTFPYSNSSTIHAHAVTWAGGDTYTYDANGNMTERPGMTLSWNAENLLEEVRDDQSPSNLIESYLYDANGQRAVKMDASGIETHYVNKWYEVRKESGQPDVETVHYWFGGQAVATDEDGTLRYIHPDHLGSSSVATDTNGDLVANNTYFPYGEHRSSTGVFGTDRDFTGQRLDGGTGLHFYNARYYDSVLGRFISPDSIVPDTYDPRSYARYVYVGNNPLRYSDPTGNCWGPARAACEAAKQWARKQFEHHVVDRTASYIESTVGDGTACLCVDLTAGFGKGASAGVGFVVDDEGNYGVQFGGGAGAFVGAGAGINLQLQVTTANSIDDLRGISVESGITVKAYGADGSVEGIAGGTRGDAYGGGSVGGGIGIGFPVGAYTILEHSGILNLGSTGRNSSNDTEPTATDPRTAASQEPVFSTVTIGSRAIKIREY